MRTCPGRACAMNRRPGCAGVRPFGERLLSAVQQRAARPVLPAPALCAPDQAVGVGAAACGADARRAASQRGGHGADIWPLPGAPGGRAAAVLKPPPLYHQPECSPFWRACHIDVEPCTMVGAPFGCLPAWWHGHVTAWSLPPSTYTYSVEHHCQDPQMFWARV